MKICIFGAGAVGGHIGGKLALAGADVTLIARGDHLAAMRLDGLVLRHGGEEQRVRPACTDDPAEAGPQDCVVVTLKTYAAPEAAQAMAPLLGPETTVVTASNGIPWWYFHKLSGPWEDRRIESVDPGGLQWRHIGPERAIGCVIHLAAEVPEPGVIEFRGGDGRLLFGEPDGSLSGRAERVVRAMSAAGFRAALVPRIREDIWNKLWGNLSFNPVSVLTGARLNEIAADPGTRAVIRAMLVESQAVGEALGIDFAMQVEPRIDMAGAVGAHKTSMLQDLERGRPLEIDAILGVVREFGELVDRPTPTIDMILALVRQRGRAFTSR